MTSKVYLASYKHRRTITSFKTAIQRMFDALTRLLTRGTYSHCELAVKRDDGLYDCYSSSYRDGGVRKKTMALPAERWDMTSVDISEAALLQYYELTKDMEYDIVGAVGVVLPFRENSNKVFCSEWCFNAINKSNQGWRFDPNRLAAMVNSNG